MGLLSLEVMLRRWQR